MKHVVISLVNDNHAMLFSSLSRSVVVYCKILLLWVINSRWGNVSGPLAA